MTSGLTGSELALVTLLCVLTIFFFPATQGPYSVVHGPMTALQAARAAARLRTIIAVCARRLSRNPVLSALVVLSRIAFPIADFRPFGLAECDSILRC